MFKKFVDYVKSFFVKKHVWRCTRCGMTDITAFELGCDKSPCPMDLYEK